MHCRLDGITSVVVPGTAGDDRVVYEVVGTPPSGLSVTFDGGAGDDTLVGPSADTTWSITGRDKGSVAGLSFTGVENLTGARDNRDTFEFDAAGRPVRHRPRRRRRV